MFIFLNMAIICLYLGTWQCHCLLPTPPTYSRCEQIPQKQTFVHTNTWLINNLPQICNVKRGFGAGNQFLDAEGCVLWKGLCDIRVGWSNSALKRSDSNLMNLFWIPRLLNDKAFHRLEIERRTNSGSDARYSVLYLAFPALTCWTNHTPSSPPEASSTLSCRPPAGRVCF